YIVTFRNPPGLEPRGFASYREEFAHYYAPLAEAHMGDPRVADLDYIAAVDLADPRDPAAAADFAAPPGLRLAWDAAHGSPVAGTIAKVEFTSEKSAASALADWERDGRLWFAEPNYASHLDSVPVTDVTAKSYADAKVWWHEHIKLPQALTALENGKVTEL